MVTNRGPAIPAANNKQNRSAVKSYTTKEKMLKAERNMSDVAKAPKPFKKIVKADQVIVLDDEALQNNLKKHKNIQKIKEQNLVDPRVLEGLSMVTKRCPAILAANNKQNRSAFKSYTTEEKMLKVDSNMLHVAKTPKPFEKNIKADQVTIAEGEALKSNLKKYKNKQNNKEKNLVDSRVKEDSSLVRIGPVIPAANISAIYPEPAAAEVFQERQGAKASQQVMPQIICIKHDNRKEDKNKCVTTKMNLGPALLIYGNISFTAATWIMRNFYQQIVTVEAKRSAMILIWNMILRMQKNAKCRSETEEIIGRTLTDLKVMVGVQNEMQL